MKTKRILACSLMALTAIPCLAGCHQDTPPFVLDCGYDNSEVEITFYHTMGQDLQEVLDLYLEDFKQEYPNIHVEHSAIGAYNDVRDQLSKDLTIGAQANISYCYPDHVALYNKTKKVIKLDDLIDDSSYGLGLSKAQKDDFVEAYYEEGKQFGDGYMYCLPFSKSTEVMYYNKTFFDEHKLSVPTTWDEMETTIKEIKKIDPVCIPLGYDSDANWFITMTEQMQSGYTSVDKNNHFIFDNQKNRDFLTKIKGWYDDGLITTKGLYGSYTSGLFTNLAAGEPRCYMCIGSSAGASYQAPELINGSPAFEVEITSIPQIDAVNSPAVISQGPSVCIFNTGDKQQIIASWLLVKWLLTNVEFQAQFSMKSGYTPVLKSVFENQTYSKWLNSTSGNVNLQAKSVKICTQQKDSYFASPAFIGSSEARDQVGNLLSAYLTGSKTLDKAFSDALDECQYASRGN